MARKEKKELKRQRKIEKKEDASEAPLSLPAEDAECPES